VVDIDISKYFDSNPHSDLRAFLDRRVTDGVIRRMIVDKWLKAGAVEDGLLRRTTEGSPQGGVISPAAASQNLPSLRRRERNSLVKNRMREICTSGS